MMSLLFLLSTVAFAQKSAFTPEGADCGDVSVIAGTAGLRNARSAIQTNANTYSASAFASRHLARGLEEDDEGGWSGRTVIDLNVTYGAAQVPVLHTGAIPLTDGFRPDKAWLRENEPHARRSLVFRGTTYA